MYDVKVYLHNHNASCERSFVIIGVMGMHFFDDCICIYATNRFYRYTLSEIEKIETRVNKDERNIL